MSGGVYEGDGMEDEVFSSFFFLPLRWKRSKVAVMGWLLWMPFLWGSIIQIQT